LQLDRLASDRWARRGVLTLLRAVWLALSIWCLALGLHLLFSVPLRYDLLAIASLLCVAIGAALVLRPRMKAQQVARRLDRRFQLNEQLSTALELEGRPVEGVADYLRDQSRQTMAHLRRTIKQHQGMPWSELGAVVALAIVVLGLLFLAGVTPFGALPGAEPLPPLAQPNDPAQQFPDEPFTPPAGQQTGTGPGDQAVPGVGDQQVLSALADALRDQSVTRSAAESLDRGDVSGAAQTLRELADQSSQLSDQSRSELAEALRDAADQIQGQDPGLAEQVRQSADGLNQGDQGAADALEGLADAVEDLGQTGSPSNGQTAPGDSQSQSDDGQGSGSGSGAGSLPGEQRSQTSERLDVDGVPVELEGEGEGNTPTQGNREGDAPEGTNDGFTQGGSPGDDRVETGADPLSIPVDLRDVVQEYFTP
jgi:hypothetical protein